jgi:hypothetical protein
MDDISEIRCKWILLENIIGKCDIGNIFYKKYVESILPYIDITKLDDERYIHNIGTGYLFYYGCIIYVVHFKQWGNCLKSIGLFNNLYMMVDHYIDDMFLSEKVKRDTLSKMKSLLVDPRSEVDKHLQIIGSMYSQLVMAHPSCKAYMIQLFNVEIESMHIQSNDMHDRDVYYQIALKKGGYTVQVLNTFVNSSDDVNSDDIAYDIGAIVQLIDDSFDLFQDIKDSIHTVATHDYHKHGNLDLLWYDIIHRTHHLSPRFFLFKVIFFNIAFYLVINSPQLYSENIKQYTKNINIKTTFLKTTTENIYNELLNQLILTK